MQVTAGRPSFTERHLSSLVDVAIESRGVPAILAREAIQATRRNVRRGDGEPLYAWRARARSYFDATLRRMSARSSDPEVARYRHRVIAGLIAGDLRQGGVSEERIAREVEEWMARSA